MAAEGATVVLTDIQEVEGEKVAADIAATGATCLFRAMTPLARRLGGDLREILDRFGHLDICLTAPASAGRRRSGGNGAGNLASLPGRQSGWRVPRLQTWIVPAPRQRRVDHIFVIFGVAGMSIRQLLRLQRPCVCCPRRRRWNAPKRPRWCASIPFIRVYRRADGGQRCQRRGQAFSDYIDNNVPLGGLGRPMDIARGWSIWPATRRLCNR